MYHDLHGITAPFWTLDSGHANKKYNSQNNCFRYVALTIKYKISGSFDVIDAGKAGTEPIRVALYGPDEIRLWASEYGDTEGAFGIRPKGGKHWLCLENGVTYEYSEGIDARHKIERTIGFALRIRSTGEQGFGADWGENGAAGPATEVENAIGAAVQRISFLSENLLTNLESLSDQTAYMKAREAMQRNLHEETFANVMRWNIMEMLVVAVVSMGQVANVWWILSKRKRMDRNAYY